MYDIFTYMYHKIIYRPYNMDPMGYAAMALRFHQAPPQAPWLTKPGSKSQSCPITSCHDDRMLQLHRSGRNVFAVPQRKKRAWICLLHKICLEKVEDIFSLKWWWKMVIYHGTIRKKHHLKQIEVRRAAMGVEGWTSRKPCKLKVANMVPTFWVVECSWWLMFPLDDSRVTQLLSWASTGATVQPPNK